MIVPVSNIDPLRNKEEQARRMWIARTQFRPASFRLIEQGHALSNVQRARSAIQVLDELRSNLHHCIDSHLQSNSVDRKKQKLCAGYLSPGAIQLLPSIVP